MLVSSVPIVTELLAAPIAVVKGRIGEDVVGLQIGMPIIVEGIAMRDLCVDATDCEVHFREPPRCVIRLLPVD